MASYDLRRILTGWDYEPGQITVRKISGDDGTVKIQMRLDLGVLQMEVSGRPDGQRPHGAESLLDHHLAQLEKYKELNGTDLGYELTPEGCQALREEAVQYYHRYLAEFVLEDFEGVERDTARNLSLLDICRKYSQEEADREALEQYRPYLIMMNTRAQVHLALRKGRFKTALARVKSGLSMICEILSEVGYEEPLEESTEAGILRSLQQEIMARMPADPVQKLESELEKAVAEERYEDAIVLRQRIEAMRSKGAPSPSRKRRK
ncbi:MAG: UvrB/UvrC motif-containing protein [Phycisphaerales bacterium]|nr:UvrB/UvrC motif-containing protein [Phycisphaerales bacterium]